MSDQYRISPYYQCILPQTGDEKTEKYHMQIIGDHVVMYHQILKS